MNSTLTSCGLTVEQDFKLQLIFIYIIFAYTMATLSFVLTLWGCVASNNDIMKHIQNIELQLTLANQNRRNYP
jgi:hypothetical protein